MIISQKKINRLVILSIEIKMLVELEYKNLISNFSSKKQEQQLLNEKLIIFNRHLNIRKKKKV